MPHDRSRRNCRAARPLTGRSALEQTTIRGGRTVGTSSATMLRDMLAAAPQSRTGAGAPLRIALLAPPRLSPPPPAYGGGSAGVAPNPGRLGAPRPPPKPLSP